MGEIEMIGKIKIGIKGSMRIFNPKPDITAHEMARIFVFVEVKQIGGKVVLSDDNDDPIYRHFDEEKA